MRIRWKLLILLLAIALAPLGVALWFGRGSATRLGNALATGTREALTDDAERFLLQTVLDHSKLLLSERDQLEHNVRIQAREAERCLAAEPPSAPEIHFTDDFESDGLLTDLVVSDKHMRVSADGTTVPFCISYTQQSFLLAPGVEAKDVADDLARLSALVPTYQLIHESQAEFVHWQYTALTSGVHSSYPGHGHYPGGFDPRKRPWFRGAEETGGLTWSPPIVDAPTRRVVLTISAPVRRPDGSFAGVTAIDIRITDVVAQVELPAEWAREAEKMIVVLVSDEETGRQRALIAAHQDFVGGDEWEMPIAWDTRVLTSADEEQFAQLVEDLVREKPAVRNLPYKGRLSLWAYGPLSGTGAALLVVVPHEHVIAPALAAEAQVRLRIAQHRTAIVTIMASVVVVVVIASVLASRRVTGPVRELAAAAHRIAAGDLETPTRIAAHDELGELGTTVNAMLPQLREHIRLKQSLALAMEVQQSLLPSKPPRVAGLDIAGKSIYCDETGGDYYDFVDLSEISPHTVGVAVGDVTGHGIAAALLMATARALLRSRADEPGSLVDLMNHMNRHLVTDVPVDRFMTLCYLLINTQEKTVRWATAGHDPAIVYTPSSDSFSELAGGSGIPLGIEPTWRYEELGPRALEAGELIIIGTDGVWEARNEQNEMFGKERLREVMRTKAHDSAAAISAAITGAVAAFRGSGSQNDDITLVVIKVL